MSLADAQLARRAGRLSRYGVEASKLQNQREDLSPGAVFGVAQQGWPSFLVPAVLRTVSRLQLSHDAPHPLCNAPTRNV